MTSRSILRFAGLAGLLVAAAGAMGSEAPDIDPIITCGGRHAGQAAHNRELRDTALRRDEKTGDRAEWHDLVLRPERQAPRAAC